MTADEIRQLENDLISAKLSEVNDLDDLRFLASRLIDTHDFLRSKLMSEPNREQRAAKLQFMRAYLPFKAMTLECYEMAEAARACGVQPIYDEIEKVEKGRLWTPPSQLHWAK